MGKYLVFMNYEIIQNSFKGAYGVSLNIGSFEIFTSVKADALFLMIMGTYRFAHNQEGFLALSYCRISCKT